MRSTTAVPLDSSPSIDQMMVDRFAAMTVTQRAAVMSELNDLCTKMMLAGIRLQQGELPEEQVRWHLAARRYGENVANQAYGPQPQS